MNERRMSADETREVLERYFAADHDVGDVMADDAVFRIMASGEEHRGPEAIGRMLDYFYNRAFNAEARPRNLVFGEGSAVGEWDFVGRHTGDFAGVPATGKDINVPLCVAYDVRDGKIVEGRVYFETPAFLAQVGALG